MFGTAFLFPGQGSQSIGMLSGLAEGFPQVDETFSEASEALGYDLWDVCQNGPEEKLNSTEITHCNLEMLASPPGRQSRLPGRPQPGRVHRAGRLGRSGVP